MKAIQLLQLGDVHYPEYRKESMIDAKDRAFPQGLQELTQLNPLQAVMRRIGKLEADFILLCGDITTRGDVGQYDDGLAYLFQNLDLNKRDPDSLHAVPGNHDVERAKVDPTGADLYAKFGSFASLWASRGLPILTVDGPRKTTFSRGPVHATVISLNSALGCGEQYYPSEIRNEMRELLRHYEAQTTLDRSFAISGQSLDTPLICQPDIEAACEMIRAQDAASIAVVLAHHNLLPQATPRIALYSELLNGGLVRSRLSSLGKAVIYCHGHIHENPIEIIQDPRSAKSRLICVAAPALARGFNRLTLEYSAERVPLGCTIECFRLNETDASLHPETFRIPLQSASDRLKYRTSKLEAMLSFVPAKGGIRSGELSSSLGKTSTKALGELLREAEWLGFLRIDDRDDKPEYWQIVSMN